MKFLFWLLFITLPIFCKAQNYIDCLTPDSGIFGLSNSRFDYYSRVRKILFDGLSDQPEIRLLLIPSFTPENVLDIHQSDETGNYYLIYRICDGVIGVNDNREELKINEYKSEIDSKSVELIKSLFLKAVKQTKYNKEDVEGRDGVNYYFFVWDYGLKTGLVWSPYTLRMKKLVEIAHELIKLAKSEKPVSFDKKLIDDIVNLRNNLDGFVD